MILSAKQEKDLHLLSNKLQKMLDYERCICNNGWEPQDDEVYNAINEAVASIQQAIEMNQHLNKKQI